MLRTKILAGAALVLMATLAVPSAANAATPTGATRCGITPARVEPGHTAMFTCAAGTFVADEPVRFTITGTNGARVPVAPRTDADVAVNGSSATTMSRAGAHGGSRIPLHALTGGSETFTVTVSGASRTITARLAVRPADGTVTASDSAPGADLAAAGSRADSVFGWVLAIIAAFAAVAFLSDRSRSRDRGRSAAAEA